MDILLCFILLFGMQYLTTAKNIYVNEGNTAQLSCNTDITNPQWDGPEGFYNYGGSADFSPKLGEKISRLSWGTNKHDLVISDVRRNDSGNYTCQGITKYLYVRVVPLPPRVMESQGSTITGSEGVMLSLTCKSSDGFPESNIVWYKRSTSSSSNALTTTTYSVHIISSNTYNITGTHSFLPSASDDGVKFICVTFFKDGSRNEQQTVVTLSLNLKPRQPTIEQLATVTAGNNVEVRCRTTGSRPVAAIYWSYRNTNLTGSSTTELDSSTNTYTVVSVLTRQVTAADNGQSVKCMVNHTLVEPLRLTATLNVQFSAKASSTKITGNKVSIADGSRALTLNCTTGSSNPASNIIWKNNSVPLSNSLQYTSWKGENNGQVRSQNLVLYPTRYMDGDVITCSVSNEVNTQSPITDTAILDLHYSPIVLIEGQQQNTFTEGESKLLSCKVKSKPTSTIEWYHGNSRISQGHPGNNILNYSLTPVNRTDYGEYRCKANNGIGTGDETKISVNIRFKPLTTTITGNTSIIADGNNLLTLTCISGSSNPISNLIWRINGVITQHSGSLSDLTGEYGGIRLRRTLSLRPTQENYGDIVSCEATNVLGTSKISTVTLDLKSFPIIVNFTRKTAARLKESASFVVIYFSNVAGTNVKVYKDMDGPQITRVNYNISESSVNIDLPAFKDRINSTGTKALISIQMESFENFGFYTVVLTNEIDSSVLSFEILPKGPPNDPYYVRVDDIQYNTARLSWIPGYDGGFAQTFIIQLSTDSMSWRNVTYDGGQNENEELQSYVLHDLQYSTRYYVRMFAFNIKGYSNFSETNTFNTPISAGSSNDKSTLIIGVVSGLVIFGVVSYAVIVTILLMRNRGKNQTKDDITTEGVNQMYLNLTSPKDKRSNTKEKNNSSRGDMKSTDKIDSDTTYTALDTQLKDKESAYEAISSM